MYNNLYYLQFLTIIIIIFQKQLYRKQYRTISAQAKDNNSEENLPRKRPKKNS